MILKAMKWYFIASVLCVITFSVMAAPVAYIPDEITDVYYDPIDDVYAFIAESRIRRSPQFLYGRRDYYEPSRGRRDRYSGQPGPTAYNGRRPAGFGSNSQGNVGGPINFPGGGGRPGGIGIQPVGQSSSQSSAQSFNNGGQSGSSVNTQSQSSGGGQASSTGGAQSFQFGPGGASGSAANSASSAGGFGAPASASAGAQSFNQNPSFGTFPSFGSGSAAQSTSSVGRR